MVSQNFKRCCIICANNSLGKVLTYDNLMNKGYSTAEWCRMRRNGETEP